MTSVTTFLVVVILSLTVLSIWLYLSLRKAIKENNRLKYSIGQAQTGKLVDLNRFVSPLIREQDPLGKMLRFLFDSEQDAATIEQGQKVCSLMLQTVEKNWGLRPVAGYRSIVDYDPHQHRGSSGDQLTLGQEVIVIDPGWVLNDEVLKLSYVISQERA